MKAKNKKDRSYVKIDYLLESDIQKLIDCDALEIYVKEDTVFIPYMMSDAVECFFKFIGCKIAGQWDKDYNGQVSASFVDNESRSALILHQGFDNVVTIWYDTCEKHLELYQYHRIAHVWVKGHEKWRRLVYIVGTIHDKVNFLGEHFSCETETKLINLMGFAPFRYWTPINESLDDYYANTRAGLTEILEIATKIADKKLLKQLEKYEKAFTSNRITERKIKKLARFLARDDLLFNFINEEIEKASKQYSQREYSKAQQEELEKLKQDATNALKRKGYAGTYPFFSKGKNYVTLYEEHPYVMQEFEYDNFGFKINAIEGR